MPRTAGYSSFRFLPVPSAWPFNTMGIVLVEMSDDRLRRIYSESGHDFSADVCASVTPGDLDGLAIENFRERWIAKAEKAGDQEQARRVRSLDDAQLLEDVGASYVRVYTFLSQIFDYGNSDLERRAIFYKHLIRLLKFGRERQGSISRRFG
ncbi:hypothetical protein LOC72_00875 [Roseiconus lacunae]|nr:hypothetical protein [Roseiconus lacunae]